MLLQVISRRDPSDVVQVGPPLTKLSGSRLSRVDTHLMSCLIESPVLIIVGYMVNTVWGYLENALYKYFFIN